MVNGERRDHEIERSLGKLVLQPRDAQIGRRDNLARDVEHPVALVDTDQPRRRMAPGHMTQRLAGAGTKVENRVGGNFARGLGHDLLELVVVGHLGPHHLEIGTGIEMKLVGHAHHPERH